LLEQIVSKNFFKNLPLAAGTPDPQALLFLHTKKTKEICMAVENLEDLFVQELSDIYSAEKQITKALPKFAKAASDEMLSEAFENHTTETEGQIERLDEVIEVCGITKKRIKCEAMEGILEEGNHIIKEMEEGPVRDTALISAAQKVEHYEISAYTSLLKLAEQLGYREAVSLLAENLDEEEFTDEKLSDLGDENLEEQFWQSRQNRSQESRGRGQWASR
jgi:ferritin-like metal-binding protein YciE